jgi:hypothetical protein
MRRQFRFAVVVLLLFLSSNVHAQGQAIFSVSPAFSGYGQTVTADFNGDGVPDLISSNGTVLLGKGDGTFSVGTPISPGTLIATADFNGDGKPDLVLLGKGDGTFQAPIVTSVASPLTFLIIGDLSGDGKPDVLGLPSLSTVLVAYLGKGDGTFAAGVNSGSASSKRVLWSVRTLLSFFRPRILESRGNDDNRPVGVPSQKTSRSNVGASSRYNHPDSVCSNQPLP